MDLLQTFIVIWLATAGSVAWLADWYLRKAGSNPQHMEVLEVALDFMSYTGIGVFIGFIIELVEGLGSLL